MLRETKNVRQVSNESKRRWFSDEFFDLIVWLNDRDEITGLQLCYDLPGDERALTWRKQSGYTHDRIDTGEDEAGIIKASPILVLDGIFEYDKIAEKFKEASGEIDKNIADFVYSKIWEYPA